MDKYEELEKWENVRYRMDAAGMDYCFREYSSFEEINDRVFHLLRILLTDAMDRMDNLVQSRIDDLQDKLQDEF